MKNPAYGLIYEDDHGVLAVYEREGNASATVSYILTFLEVTIMKKTVALLIAILMSASVLTACGKSQDVKANEEGQQEIGTQLEENEDISLAGSWQDEVSQRASMDVKKNEDGSYDILVSWGSSASETSTWEIHGTYDAQSGTLTYDNGKYSVHTWDEKDNETISGEETTKGSFSNEGDKLRWKDSKNSADGLFVKVSD